MRLLMVSFLIEMAAFSTAMEMETYCQNDVFKAECADDEVIIIQNATYGRMRIIKDCIQRDYGYVGQCQKNALHVADAMCSGKRSCQIPIPNPRFDELKPCPSDLKSFLEIAYTCQKVFAPRGEECISSVFVNLPATSGIIPSVLTEESNLGSADCPWLIQAEKGQRINVTFMNFNTSNVNEHSCHALAVLREHDTPESLTVCRKSKRSQNVLVTQTNALELRILTARVPGNSIDRRFLLKYEVIGCADPSIPRHGWAKRDPDNHQVAQFGCAGSDDSWQMKCEGHKWVGKSYNCSEDGVAMVSELTWGEGIIPFGVSVMIILGIALAIGFVILLIGLIFLRNKRRRREAKPPPSRTDNSNYNASRKYHAPAFPEEENPYATENEYAYISEFPPPPPPIASQSSVKESTAASNYCARNAHPSGYGTTGQYTPCASNPTSQSNPPGRATRPAVRMHSSRDHAVDPPKYMELDPNPPAFKVVPAGRGPPPKVPKENVTLPKHQNFHHYPHQAYPFSYDSNGYDHLANAHHPGNVSI